MQHTWWGPLQKEDINANIQWQMCVYRWEDDDVICQSKLFPSS